eukprot:gene5233-18467_t
MSNPTRVPHPLYLSLLYLLYLRLLYLIGCDSRTSFPLTQRQGINLDTLGPDGLHSICSIPSPRYLSQLLYLIGRDSRTSFPLTQRQRIDPDTLVSYGLHSICSTPSPRSLTQSPYHIQLLYLIGRDSRTSFPLTQRQRIDPDTLVSYGLHSICSIPSPRSLTQSPYHIQLLYLIGRDSRTSFPLTQRQRIDPDTLVSYGLHSICSIPSPRSLTQSPYHIQLLYLIGRDSQTNFPLTQRQRIDLDTLGPDGLHSFCVIPTERGNFFGVIKTLGTWKGRIRLTPAEREGMPGPMKDLTELRTRGFESAEEAAVAVDK